MRMNEHVLTYCVHYHMHSLERRIKFSKQSKGPKSNDKNQRIILKFSVKNVLTIYAFSLWLKEYHSNCRL